MLNNNLNMDIFKHFEKEAFCNCSNCNILNNKDANETIKCFMYDPKTEDFTEVNIFKECKSCIEAKKWYFVEFCDLHKRWEILPHSFLWIDENTCKCDYNNKMNFSVFVSKVIENNPTFKNDLYSICDPVYLRNDRFFSTNVNLAFEKNSTCLIRAYQKEGVEIDKKYCECKNNDFSNCSSCIWNYWKKLYNDYLNNL